AASNSPCSSIAVIGNSPSKPISSEKTSPPPPTNGSKFNSRRTGARMWFTSNAHDRVEPKTSPRHRIPVERRNHPRPRHGKGVQGGRRTGDQESARAARQNRRELVHRAFHPDSHQLRTRCA